MFGSTNIEAVIVKLTVVNVTKK